MPYQLPDHIQLENERVRLEPLTWDHLDDLLPICLENPDLLRYSPSPWGSEEGLRAYFDIAFAAKAKGQRYPFATFDKQENQYAGSTSFGSMAPNHDRIEIGWTWIRPALQLTGLNRKAKHLMLDFAFTELGCERVEFRADSRNTPSRGAMEALGAILEGELRNHTRMRDGFRRSTVYYSILRDEWPKP